MSSSRSHKQSKGTDAERAEGGLSKQGSDAATPEPAKSIIDLQQKAGNRAVSEAVDDALRSPGRPLEPATRREMESRFQQDFSEVRVHTDAQAAESAAGVRAKAYTVGRDIVFGAGRFAPATSEGRRLLAHELTHVVQQRSSASTTVSPNVAEAESRHAALQVVQGQSAEVSTAAPVGLQRDPDGPEEKLKPGTGAYAAAHGYSLVKIDRSTHWTNEQQRQKFIREYIEYAKAHNLRTQYEEAIAAYPESTPASGATATDPEMELIRQWLAASEGQPATKPAPAPSSPEPDIAAFERLRKGEPLSGRKTVRVVEFFVPETRFSSPFGAWGSTRMFSQAQEVAEYEMEIDKPDPSAGYNFDTYLWNITTGKRIAAQHLGGTRYRVLMGSPECPGCHFGRGLEVDLHGESFVMVMAPQVMAGAGAFRGLGRGRMPRPMTPKALPPKALPPGPTPKALPPGPPPKALPPGPTRKALPPGPARKALPPGPKKKAPTKPRPKPQRGQKRPALPRSPKAARAKVNSFKEPFKDPKMVAEQQEIMELAKKDPQAAGRRYEDLVGRDIRGGTDIQNKFRRQGRRMDIGTEQEVTIEGATGRFSSNKLDQLWDDLADKGNVTLTVPKLSPEASDQLARMLAQAQQKIGPNVIIVVRETLP